MISYVRTIAANVYAYKADYQAQQDQNITDSFLVHLRLISLDQLHNIANVPETLLKAIGHGWLYADGAADPGEIIAQVQRRVIGTQLSMP